MEERKRRKGREREKEKEAAVVGAPCQVKAHQAAAVAAAVGIMA